MSTDYEVLERLSEFTYVDMVFYEDEQWKPTSILIYTGLKASLSIAWNPWKIEMEIFDLTNF